MLERLPYEARLAFLIAFAGWTIASGVLGIIKARRAAKAGTKYVFARWDGNGLVTGRAIAPKWAMAGAVVSVVGGAAGALILGVGRFPRPDFAFEAPPGWRDLSHGRGDWSGIPELPRQAMAQLATRTDRFAVDVNQAGLVPPFFGAGAIYHGPGFDEPGARGVVIEEMIAMNNPSADLTDFDLRTVAGKPYARGKVRFPAGHLTLYLFPKHGWYAEMSCFIPDGASSHTEATCDATAEANVQRN